MSRAQRIAKNIGIILISQFIAQIFLLLSVMSTARYLEAEGFGILSFATAFAAIFEIMTNLGFHQLTIREVARHKLQTMKYMANIITMKILLNLLTLGSTVIIISLSWYPKQTIIIVFIIALAVSLNSFSNMFYSIFQAFERMEYFSFGLILNNFLILVLVLYSIWLRLEVTAFAIIQLLVSLIILVYSVLITSWKFGKPRFEVDLKFWKTILREAVPFGLTEIFIAIYLWISSILLSILKGNEAVGYYSAAFKLTLTLLIIPNAINRAVFPLMSKFFMTSNNSLNLLNLKHFKIMLMIGIPLGVGTTLFADRFILLLFGTTFFPSVIILQILIWSTVFIFARTSYERVLESVNRQLIVTKIFGICTFLNILLNFILIPSFSYIGSAIAMLITDFAVFVLIFIQGKNIGYGVSFRQFTQITTKILFACIPMTFFILIMKKEHLLFVLVFSIILYCGSVFLVKALDDEDIAILKTVIKFKTKVV